MDALENAKPIESISLKDVVLVNGDYFKSHVVLLVLSTFTFILLPHKDAFEHVGEDRSFPVKVSEQYFRSATGNIRSR